MALSGVHISYSLASAAANSSSLPLEVLASDTMAANGAATVTSAVVAPATGKNNPLLSISASVPIFYAVGKSPNPQAGNPRRYYDPTIGGREDIFVLAGDKFAWTPA